jgi:hypothetical protein
MEDLVTNAAGGLATACPTINLALAPSWVSPFLAAFQETLTFLLVVMPAFLIEGRAESSMLRIALGEGRIGCKSSFGVGDGREGSGSGMLLRSAETGEDKRSDSRHPPWGIPSTPPSKFQAGSILFQAVLFQTGT